MQTVLPLTALCYSCRCFLVVAREGMQQKPEDNNKLHFLPIRFCFINIYTYPNPKPTPYNNAKTVIIVVQKNLLMLYWCAHAQ